MAGTDHRRRVSSGGPAIILVEPQLGENIGAAARAMYNCGLTELRLVRPRDGWPSDKAVAMSSGAGIVLDHAEGCGILFGPERAGLVNDHVALADTVLSVPLNPAFSSLNLAQAVLLVGYEWFAAGEAAPAELMQTGHSRPGTKEELLGFLAHLEEALDRSGFMRTKEKRPSMVRNLRNLFQRAQCTEQELRTLHGVVTALAGPRERRAPAAPESRVQKAPKRAARRPPVKV